MPWTKLQADARNWPDLSAHADGARRMSYRDALREAHSQALAMDPRVFVMGEGVDDPGGVFGTTLGLAETFGNDRVFDLPLAENGFTGIAVGAALAGMRPIIVHMRTDFLLMSMDQIVNHAAKWRYMFGGNQTVPLTIRCITGRGWGSAAQHSQSLQALFLHCPGLKLVMPASACDAKGLLLASIADPGPVLVIEHRWLYDHSEHVPEEPYAIPLGVASLKRSGSDVTLVGVSYMVPECLEAARKLEEQGIQADVIDLRTLNPLDSESIVRSVEKTGRLVIADTGWKTGGVASEIATLVYEQAFEHLKAPIRRVTLPDTPTPASPVLEQAFYPSSEDIVHAAKKCCNGRVHSRM